MRMSRKESCIVPGCKNLTRAKPIYIQLTIDGTRTWLKVGGLCKNHLAVGMKPESQYDDPDNNPEVRAMREAMQDGAEPRDIVDMVLPQDSEKVDKDVAHWREVSDLGKKVLPSVKKKRAES